MVGSCASTVFTSFEKRFMMRPMGVVSKNDMGARRMRLSMASKVERAARSPKNMHVAYCTKRHAHWPMAKAAYTPR